MSFENEYIKQLAQINSALETCNEAQKEELLSLKNSIEELLSLTGENESEDVGEANRNIDDEYALFMEEINDEVSKTSDNSQISPSNDGKATKFQSMEGKKCKAPHVNRWGGKGYHNAMICSILEPEGNSDIVQAKILFTNPTHEEMRPCPYYFDSDCKFSDEKCKYSHGEIVSISELQDYIEPEFESLQIGSEILAKQKNELWGRARITKILNESCMVKFETCKKDEELSFNSIFPLEKSLDENEDESSDDEDVYKEQDVINLSLLNAPSDGPLGDWEKYTKGFGSKLMQKMGYIVGTGLGKEAKGRIEPVTAVILPAGKSLDHCMYLREKAGGDKDLFNAEKRIKIRQKKLEERQRKAYEKDENKGNIFKFLNDSLSCSNGQTSFNKSQNRRNMKKETSRNLNVASLKTDEDIKKTERDLYVIKESLSRHKDINSHVHKNLKRKLHTTMEELEHLKSQAQSIQNEQNLRKDKRKLTIF